MDARTRRQEERRAHVRQLHENFEVNRARYLAERERKLPLLVELQDRMQAGESGAAVLAETARQLKKPRPMRTHTLECIARGGKCRPGDPC